MRFSHFEIKPDSRCLLVDGQEMTLGARAFDVLVALATQHGQVVSKSVLLDSAWPDVVVEENNLQVQISTLRKLLGANTITTVPGRGYCLVSEPMDVQQQEPRPSFETTLLPLDEQAMGLVGNLPAHIPVLLGREADVPVMRKLLTEQRLITITGTGGVGKTHFARYAAAVQRDDWPGGVWWLDATTVQDVDTLVSSLAQCFRIGLSSAANALDELCYALQSQQVLLVLDNCEHVVEATRHVVESLLNKTHELQVLATSQVRLRLADEYVYQLGTLALPSRKDSADQALQCGAIQLFVQRVQQLDRHFSLTDASTLNDVRMICEQLGGVALAIEMAAARVPLLGVSGVHQRLADRLRLLGDQPPSSAEGDRHATMRTTLDWSHRLLDEKQARMLRRLSTFVGSFSLDAAKLLLCDETQDEWSMLDVLDSLIQQSWVMVTDDGAMRYWLLETHRLYAFEKLKEAEELLVWQQRFASAMLELSKQLVKARNTQALWAEMNHIRVAYDWAVLQPGKADREIAIGLAVASAMVLAVSGYVHEAMTRLLTVEPWVGRQTPQSITARYWQWLGRVGVNGRLPTSRCVEAFIKSEKIFQSLQDWRHVHACRRMRAEAFLDNNQLDEAKAALLEAQVMETPDWPVADRMRRIRVQALLNSKKGSDQTALRLANEALALAELANIERYVLVIQLDIARMHLKMQNLDDALSLLRFITDQPSRSHYHRLTIAQAYAGLMVALIRRHALRDAAAVGLKGIAYWRSSGILMNQCDVLAWWLASIGSQVAAVRMLGASNAFYASRELVRESTMEEARSAVMAMLTEQTSPDQLSARLSASATSHISEDDLARSLESELNQYLQLHS